MSLEMRRIKDLIVLDDLLPWFLLLCMECRVVIIMDLFYGRGCLVTIGGLLTSSLLMSSQCAIGVQC